MQYKLYDMSVRERPVITQAFGNCMNVEVMRMFGEIIELRFPAMWEMEMAPADYHYFREKQVLERIGE